MGVILPATGADRSLQDVLAGSFTVQFTLRKAALHLADSGEAAFTLRRALSEAASKNAEYLLVGTYSTTATEILLQVELYSVSSGEKIRSASTSGRINLSMDTLVAQALEKTLTGIRFQEASAVVAPPAVTTPQPIAPATGGPREPTTAPAVVSDTGRTPPWKRFGISSGVAPLIATGPASDYAKLGVLTTFAVDLRFPFAAGALEAGVLSGACWLSASGAVSAADILIIPVGADLRYLLNSGAFPGIILHVSGGPALMRLRGERDENRALRAWRFDAGSAVLSQFRVCGGSELRGIHGKLAGDHGVCAGGIVVCTILTGRAARTVMCGQSCSARSLRHCFLAACPTSCDRCWTGRMARRFPSALRQRS
jgi:hypothetical protein